MIPLQAMIKKFHNKLLLLILSIYASCGFASLDFLKTPSEMNTPAYLPIKDAFHFFASINLNTKIMALNWDIFEGYYLYKDKFKIFNQNNPVIKLSFSKPPALIEDDFFGEQKIYRKNISIMVDTDGITGDTLDISFQGCADLGYCYPESHIQLTINRQNGQISSNW